MKNKHLIFSVRGLTLLETLVSVTIITLVIIGPLSYIITSSSYARQTKDAMTATYIAEEAVELLQNRYDSLYITCNKQPGIGPCVTVRGETTGQIAWRVFKEKMAAGGGFPSCYKNENSSGCSFDYIDMYEPLNNFPSRYTSVESQCPTLVGVGSTSLFSYVCRGVPSHISGTVTSAAFKRVVYIEHLPTFESTPRNEQYNDDLRITVDVVYRAANGANRSVEIVRYMHARP